MSSNDHNSQWWCRPDCGPAVGRATLSQRFGPIVPSLPSAARSTNTHGRPGLRPGTVGTAWLPIDRWIDPEMPQPCYNRAQLPAPTQRRLGSTPTGHAMARISTMLGWHRSRPLLSCIRSKSTCRQIFGFVKEISRCAVRHQRSGQPMDGQRSHQQIEPDLDSPRADRLLTEHDRGSCPHGPDE